MYQISVQKLEQDHDSWVQKLKQDLEIWNLQDWDVWLEQAELDLDSVVLVVQKSSFVSYYYRMSRHSSFVEQRVSEAPPNWDLQIDKLNSLCRQKEWKRKRERESEKEESTSITTKSRRNKNFFAFQNTTLRSLLIQLPCVLRFLTFQSGHDDPEIMKYVNKWTKKMSGESEERNSSKWRNVLIREVDVDRRMQFQHHGENFSLLAIFDHFVGFPYIIESNFHQKSNSNRTIERLQSIEENNIPLICHTIQLSARVLNVIAIQNRAINNHWSIEKWKSTHK